MGDVVQFKYGADGLDPVAMEGHDRPVDLKRMLLDVTVLQSTYTVKHSFSSALYLGS